MKKILIVTTISGTINAFLVPHIMNLLEQGYIVEIASNGISKLDQKILNSNIVCHDISFSRKPLSKNNIRAYKELKKILINNTYSIIHTHTPNASALVRLLARKLKLRNIYYTAHGFHFYKKAPLLNWMLYYPIEKYLSKFTHTLITINSEDYELAKRKFKSNRVFKIPGIGLNFERLEANSKESNEIEAEFAKNKFHIISVGELNKNKNHQVIIKSLNHLQDDNIMYHIVGTGNNINKLEKLVRKYNLGSQIKFWGYRDDIANLIKHSDLFAFPSRREGLGIAALEALYLKCPLVTSNIHGINDYSFEYINSLKCSPNDYLTFAKNIRLLSTNNFLKKTTEDWVKNNIEKYNIKNVIKLMESIYSENDE